MKKCVRTYRNVEVFKFHMGDWNYSSVWSNPDVNYDPFDRISEILFDLSLKGRNLTSCSIQDSAMLGLKVFAIGSRATPDHTTNIDADLIAFFIDEIRQRQELKKREDELKADIPEEFWTT